MFCRNVSNENLLVFRRRFCGSDCCGGGGSSALGSNKRAHVLEVNNGCAEVISSAHPLFTIHKAPAMPFSEFLI